MDMQSTPNTGARATNAHVRQLASLKILSRLLAHELHTQANAKVVQLSREELVEIQTTIDLYIEDVTRRNAPNAGAAVPEPTLVTARMEARN